MFNEITVSILLMASGATAPALDEVTLVDLSHTYDGNTLFWPTSPVKFEHNKLAYGPSGKGYFYSAYTFSTSEHGGTHLDAPIHFSWGAKTVGELKIEDLYAPLAVIDVSAKANADRDYRVTTADIEAYEEEFGKIEPGTAVCPKNKLVPFLARCQSLPR